MARGFQVLDGALDLPPYTGRFCDISAVSFSPQPYRHLKITLGVGGLGGQILCDDPVSHRVHDEREILPYWTARAEEGVALGCFYAIAHSAYLEELSRGLSGLTEPLSHYLVIGTDVCVEIIARSPPRIIPPNRSHIED